MMVRRYSPEDESFLRLVIIPEEDRYRFTAASPKLMLIEHWRRLNVQPAAGAPSHAQKA